MFNMFCKTVSNFIDLTERLRDLSTHERDYEDYEDYEDGEIVTSYIDSKGYHVDYSRRK